MKLLATILIAATSLTYPPHWLTDMKEAKAEAAQEHKMILISFSGSDWCGPCIRLHKDIFEAGSFSDFASKNLVLVNADFPRFKKNQLPADQVKRNEALADQYNPKGIFPCTVLVDGNGKVIRKWEGYPNETPEQFSGEINSLIHAGTR